MLLVKVQVKINDISHIFLDQYEALKGATVFLIIKCLHNKKKKYEVS